MTTIAHRVVIVGGGFAGIRAARKLADAPVEVTLIDRRNFHLFQPLSYQVATGALSPNDVAYPLRALFKSYPNVRVLMAEVSGFDLERRRVRFSDPPLEPLAYDTLIVAAGSSYSYFGHEEWRAHAGEVKSLESAVTVRSRILSAFERAEMSSDPAQREAELTFVVVGGGPTGVEMAGQIGELARDTLHRNFRAINSRAAQVLLVEMGDRLLASFPESLSAKASHQLEQLGVTPTVGQTVVAIAHDSVTLRDSEGGERHVPCKTVIWAAGVNASGLAVELGRAAGAEVDKAGRVTVEPDLTLAGHPEVFVLGDMVRVRGADGTAQQLPGVAPVAIQQGVHTAKTVAQRLQGEPAKPFRYFDKGNVATIGRGRAVVDLGFLRLSGFPAWVIWLVIHIWYLIGFQNRLLVVVQWTFSFAVHGRSGRLIVDTHEDPPATGR
ncbi:MAG: NAD(P)/FAD-dependent oxidoreductase [Solirubrobacteraceae bacterium]